MRLCECGKPVAMIDPIYRAPYPGEECDDCEHARQDRDDPIAAERRTFQDDLRDAQDVKYGRTRI